MHDKRTAPLSPALQQEAYALLQCLDYLEHVAAKSGFALTARMITLAIDATQDVIDPSRIRSKTIEHSSSPAGEPELRDETRVPAFYQRH